MGRGWYGRTEIRSSVKRILILCFVVMLVACLGGVALAAQGGGPHEGGELDVATDLFYLVIILLAAKLCGELFERFHQPTVLGELVAGVIIGGSVLNLVPLTSRIELLAELGVIILLFQVGLESRLHEMLRVGLPSLFVAVIGVVLPFALGYFTSIAMGIAGGDVQVAIFIGATLTATSVGITARVLADMRELGSDEGKIILGAAVIDDVMGLVILAVVVALMRSGSVEVGNIVKVGGIAVLFLGVTLVAGSYGVPRLMSVVQRMQCQGIITVTCMIFAFALSFVAAELGLATIVGAFAAGLLLEEEAYYKRDPVWIPGRAVRLAEVSRPIANLLVPIFFVKMGMLVDVQVFLKPEIVIIAALITVVAIAGKLVCGWGAVGIRANKIAIGVGMVPRGEVGLIFASYGLAHHVISTSLYSSVLLMVIITTFITPPLLKVAFHKKPSELPGTVGEPGLA